MDVVNAYFRRFYPVEMDRRDPCQWSFASDFRGGGWEYNGPGRHNRIFPAVLCADGSRISVQGHYGAYCFPNDDFCENAYRTVEVKGPTGIKEFAAHADYEFGDGTRIYAFVPVGLVVQFIERHGGLFDWNTADLGTPTGCDR